MIKKLEHDPSYYFVRSLGMVSGICMKQPDNFPGDEGQMFNYQRELRWKKQGSQYDLLLLSQVESDLDSKWQKISRESNREIEWKICDRQAHFYDSDETRFPQGFVYKGMNDKNIEPKTIPIFSDTFKMLIRQLFILSL
ncbi:MAG: hypothetical protein HC820_06695 [Hydrococcus sp. RM1_1_31]|nr:hypothetical protein [Hydrococcus sp. RM1_1_31]